MQTARKTIGFENPNSFVKVCSGPSNPIVYRNTLSRPPRESFKGNGRKKIYTVNGESYIVGKARDYETSSSKSTERYGSKNFYTEGIIALSQYTQDGDNIRAVTGLPAKHYTEEMKKKVKAVFERTHTLKINNEQLTFTVSDCRVMLQPMGTYAYMLRDRRGIWRTNAQKLMDQKVLINDLGFGSFDFAVVVENDLDDWGEAQYAMFDVYKEIWIRLAGKYREKPIATAKMELFNLEKQLRTGDYFEHAAETYYVGDIKTDVYALYAGKMMDSISNHVDMKEFDLVAFSGGGILALQPYIAEHLVNKNSVPIVSAQTANVEGFYVYGEFLID